MRALTLTLMLAVPAAATEALFDANGCRACHKVGPRGGNAGPDLTLAGLRHSADWLEEWLADPLLYKPGTTMPRPGLEPGL
jgi:cytochrome c2